MEVNNNTEYKKLEQILKLQMITSMFKQSTSGNSTAFYIVMESLLRAMQDSEGNIDLDKLGLGEVGLRNLGYGGKERVEKAYRDVKNSTSSGNTSIDEAVEKASRKYGVDKKIIMAVIKQESSFNPNAVSSAGAQGLMQLMPGTAAGLGVKDAFDIEQNVDGGTKYLRNLLDMFGNCKEMALAGYNAGPNAVKRRGMRNKNELYKMPTETRDYVNKVMKYYG